MAMFIRNGHGVARLVQPIPTLMRGRAMASLPVGKVARMFKFKVDGEEQAVKADELVARAVKLFKENVNGYAGVDRYCCKSEWDYMVLVKFDSLPHLQDYLAEGGAREKLLDPVLVEVKDLVGDVHVQNFLHEEL